MAICRAIGSFYPLCRKKKASSLRTSEPLPRKAELLMIDLSRAKSKTRTRPEIPARRDDKKISKCKTGKPCLSW